MVAVASARPAAIGARRARAAWSALSLTVLVVGLSLRLWVGGGAGGRSAVVLAALLWLGVWSLLIVRGAPRMAFLVTLLTVAVLNLAAWPPRNQPAFDDLQALYRTDQSIAVDLAVPRDGARRLNVLAQPVFSGARPTFDLAASVNGTSLGWACDWRAGVQLLDLPLPPATVDGDTTAHVRLQLTGSPSREGDYLVVYASSLRGGLVISLDSAATSKPEATACTLV